MAQLEQLARTQGPRSFGFGALSLVLTSGRPAGSVRTVLQVLVDADNLHRARVAALLRALPDDAVLSAAGSPTALAAVDWPTAATLLPRTGWQRADLELAAAYTPDDGPLVLASGDGDFAQLGRRHAGHVLVVSDSPSSHLRAGATVLDPVHDGPDAVRAWIRGALTTSRRSDGSP
jgi:hypothetical protein